MDRAAAIQDVDDRYYDPYNIGAREFARQRLRSSNRAREHDWTLWHSGYRMELIRVSRSIGWLQPHLMTECLLDLVQTQSEARQ